MRIGNSLILQSNDEKVGNALKRAELERDKPADSRDVRSFLADYPELLTEVSNVTEKCFVLH